MSAQPRSDRRVDQGEELKKGNSQRTPRTTSVNIDAWSCGSEGRSRRAVAPLAFLFPLCFRYPASPAPARPRYPWRSRAFGGGVQAADRGNLAKKEVSPDGRKEESKQEESREEVVEEEVG